MTDRENENGRPLDKSDHPTTTTTPSRNASATVELSRQQREAVEIVRARLARPTEQVTRVFGYAGTGKTTIAKRLTNGCNAVFGAYTGKAVSVLRRSGVPTATTIHSAIYRPKDRPNLRLLIEQLRRNLAIADPSQRPAIEQAIAEAEAEQRSGGFELNPGCEWASADLIVLDEVSMVDGQMADDIESFGRPILVLGDPAQLPPVNGAGRYVAEGVVPDVLLTEVHRQAADSPVLAMATRIREHGHAYTDGRYDLGAALAADQVLCWKNSTRWQLVEAMRHARGLPPGQPTAGDRVMCLRNNRELGVFNGAQFTVEHVTARGGGWELSVADELGIRRNLQAFAEGFLGLAAEKELTNRYGVHRAKQAVVTFADAITVHKAQGSGWPVVYVVDETPGLRGMTMAIDGDPAAADRAVRRWAYTAATRAEDAVTFVRHPGGGR